jgi:CCR4-NOT transcription complex subunit 7/8
MMNEPLSPTRSDFNRYLRIFFPNIYDIKSFQQSLSDYFEGGGLNKIADILDIKRIGTTHQAGSDSLVTSQVFFKLKSNFEAKFQ